MYHYVSGADNYQNDFSLIDAKQAILDFFENFISSSARDSDRSLVIDQASMSHKSSYDFLQSIIHIPNLMASVDPEIRSILLF